MAKFKCKHTGNVVEFTLQNDIDTMRKHNEYVEVVEEKAAPMVVEKKVGRPTKAKEE